MQINRILLTKWKIKQQLTTIYFKSAFVFAFVLFQKKRKYWNNEDLLTQLNVCKMGKSNTQLPKKLLFELINGASLLDRIRPKSMLEFFSTFPWGKYGAIASQFPTIRILCGSRSFPVKWIQWCCLVVESLSSFAVNIMNEVRVRHTCEMKFFSNLVKNSKYRRSSGVKASSPTTAFMAWTSFPMA